MGLTFKSQELLGDLTPTFALKFGSKPRIVKEGFLPTIATLGYMVWKT